MRTIKNQEFGGERPLYCEHDLYLENVVIHAVESAIKETSDITAVRCRFEGKYPFWCCDRFTVKDCIFTVGARAALWYSRDLLMEDTIVDAPKMFREMDRLTLRRVAFSDAAETLWSCRGVKLEGVRAEHADYIFMRCRDVEIDDFHLNGNYSFQWTENVVIRNSIASVHTIVLTVFVGLIAIISLYSFLLPRVPATVFPLSASCFSTEISTFWRSSVNSAVCPITGVSWFR